MKKIVLMLCTFIFVISLSGCKKDSMEDITIYTTTYPVEYITSKLYGEYSNVSSIYPNEVIKLTDKLIRDYSTGNLFVYPSYRFEVVDNSPVVTNYKTVVAMLSKFNGKKVVISRTSEYIVISENNSSYFIINDSGQIAKYPKSYFIELNK